MCGGVQRGDTHTHKLLYLSFICSAGSFFFKESNQKNQYELQSLCQRSFRILVEHLTYNAINKHTDHYHVVLCTVDAPEETTEQTHSTAVTQPPAQLVQLHLPQQAAAKQHDVFKVRLSPKCNQGFFCEYIYESNLCVNA